MKRTDGFGLEHRPDCRGPAWGIAKVLLGAAGRVAVQQCRGCGLVWRPGEPAGSPRPISGYPGRRR